MKKPVPGSDVLYSEIDSSCFYHKDGSIVHPKDDKITISFFGKTKTLSFTWLKLLSHFEIKLSKIKDYDYVEFSRCESRIIKSPSVHVCHFSKPIELKGFRIVPGFTHLAVSRDGKRIYDHRENKYLKTNCDLKNKYITVETRDPDRGKNRSVRVHRLVALAWVKNDDWNSKVYVNHIDHDRTNPNAINLEWCTCKENTLAAVNAGQFPDVIPCKMKDHDTGKIMVFSSILQAMDYIGGNKADSINVKNILFRKSNLLFRKRYEFKPMGDSSNWQERGRGFNVRNRRVYEITYAEETEVFYTLKQIQVYFKLWNMSPSVPTFEKALKSRYGQASIRVKEKVALGVFQALEIKTGLVTEANSRKKLAELTGVPYGVIQSAFSTIDASKVRMGFQFRLKSEVKWPPPVFDKSGVWKIEVTNEVTGKQVICGSQRAISRSIGITPTTLVNCIRENRQWKNFTFKRHLS